MEIAKATFFSMIELFLSTQGVNIVALRGGLDGIPDSLVSGSASSQQRTRQAHFIRYEAPTLPFRLYVFFLVAFDKETALSYLAIGVKKKKPPPRERRRSPILNILGRSDEKKRQKVRVEAGGDKAAASHRPRTNAGHFRHRVHRE